MITNNADAVSLAIGLVLPAVVALFTKSSTNSTVKATAHAVLAVATGFVSVYQADPGKGYWAPAVVAAFLAWLVGTTFYHSLLKKYQWFGWLQSAVVREAETLHTGPVAAVVKDLPVAQAAEQTDGPGAV